MIQDDLISLGLSKEEANVYLATMELGGGFVSVIARMAKVHRVTCYNTLGNLVKKGLITYTTRQRVRLYIPEPPQVFFNQLSEKYLTAKKVLPELVALQRSDAFTPKIRFYEEKENMVTIFNDMAEAKTEILGYTNLVPLQALFPDVMEKFGNAIVKKKLHGRFLSPFEPENQSYIKQFFHEAISTGLLEILCVNPQQFPFKNGVFFYDTKMAIISYAKHELLGVMVESAVNTQTQKAMFDLAWLGATSFIVH